MSKKQVELIPDKKAAIRLEHVKKALHYIKTCPYKGTAIKFELEADLNRGDDDGEYDTYCDTCAGDGDLECMTCAGEGGENIGEDDFIICEDCSGDGRVNCDTCAGTGYYEDDVSNFSHISDCKQFILDHVSAEARDALIFSRFYVDGSVDSEYTFTLKIDEAWRAIEFIEAFKALAHAIGNGLDTDGAGMHIAVLNQKDGNYPGGNSLSSKHAHNFASSMSHLLPALFFLGSADHRSRGLDYRHPTIDISRKHSAISGGANEGCYEFRVFETCYDHPDRVHDFICVIAKSLQFYVAKQKKCPFFDKIGTFGFRDQGEGLERFYYTRNHLEALRAGVEILKPDYKSVQELRKERNFKLTFKKIDEQDKKRRYKWLEEFRTLRPNEAVETPQEYVKVKQVEFLNSGVEATVTV